MMTDQFFASRVKMLYDECSLPKEEKKSLALLAAYACDTEEHEKAITDYLKKDGITLISLRDFIFSITPDVEIVDDE